MRRILLPGLLLLWALSCAMLIKRYVEVSPRERLYVYPSFPRWKGDIKRYTLQLEHFLHTYSLDSATQRSILRGWETLGLQPAPRHVTIGLDNQFFSGDQFGNGIRDALGYERHHPDSIRQALQTLLACKAHAEAQGARFYTVVCRNGASAMPQLLPYHRGPHPSRLTLLKRAADSLATTAGETPWLLDLGESLRQQSPYRPYFRTDTHWTPTGAMLGGQQLLEHIHKDFPDAPLLRITDYIPEQGPSLQMDMARMLMLPKQESILRYRPRDPNMEVTGEIPPLDGYRTFHVRKAPNQLKVLIFQDSFFIHLSTFLPTSFGEVTAYWGTYRGQMVASYRPDIVIFELVERRLDELEHPQQYHMQVDMLSLPHASYPSNHRQTSPL